MGRVWFRVRSACPPPFLLLMCGVGVRAGPRSRLCPALLGLVVGVCFLPFIFPFFGFVVAVAGCPCPGPCGPCPPIPFLSGWAAGFFFSVVCVCMFRCPISRWAAVPGLVLPVLAGWSPCASLGVLSFRLWCLLGRRFGRLLWCSRVVRWLWAVLAPPPSPPCSFSFGGGGLPVPPSAFPGLAHALARIQCGLPGCCWRLRSVWPCSSPMGRVGYVHGGLGAPSCRVRSWLCRLGGCARRLRVALG